MVGPQARHNALPPVGKDELAGGAPWAPTKSNSTPISIPAASWAPTPTPTQTPAPTQAFAQAPGPPGLYMDADLQKATKLALDLFVKGQEHGQLQANTAPQERPLKARFSNLYYGNLHLNCYRFCQQYKDHFKTARANGPNQIFFAALFLCESVV